MHTGESAINRGLAKRLKDLEKERERRNRAAREEDLQFSLDFLSTSRKVFRMIDKDDSGTLEKQEVIDAVSADKKVINFLVNCGEPNLQYLLVPARLESALQQLDTDRDGHIDAQEWEDAIEDALSNKLAQRALKREADAAAAQREIENFTYCPCFNPKLPLDRACSRFYAIDAAVAWRCTEVSRVAFRAGPSSRTPRASASSSSTRTRAGP